MKSNRAVTAFPILKDRCFFLLLTLVAFILIYHYVWIDPGLTLTLSTITVVAGVYAASRSKGHAVIAASIGALELVFTYMALTHYSAFFAFASSALLSVFFGFTLVRILMYVMRGRKVTRDKIFGAICVYLLIGFSWAPFYRMVFLLNPAAFSGSRTVDMGINHFDFVYYSFETLCTLGLGDIHPISGFARALTVVEALTGVLYVAVLISRLVSMYRVEGEE